MHICPPSHCGEYYDGETKTYYLRARYYDPNIGRFTQQDTHWTTANSIYGDNPQKINEREDKLGLKTYSYAPQITAVMQSGNLYVYGVNNPVAYVDRDGQIAIEFAAIFLAVLAAGIAIATLPYLQKICADLGKALTALAEELDAEIHAISKKAAEALAKARTAISAAAAAPVPPPPDDPHSKGTRTTSKTLYEKGNMHIDVENPGHRPGQIHLQIGREKYIYDVSNQVFKTANGNLAPRSIQALLDRPEIIEAIMKGLTYIGY